MRVTTDRPDPPSDWDARAVEPPGGHVMQSATWGTYRASQGWDPHFLTFDDERVALVLLRSSAGLPGSEAVVRRGPAHADEGPQASAARAAALATWARAAGARHEVESFASIADSVESYLLNLNSHERYNDLRAERQRLIDAGQPVTGAALAPYTTAYSERREAYTREIVDLIRHNRLEHALEREGQSTDA